MRAELLISGVAIAAAVLAIGGYLALRWRRTGKPTSWLDRVRLGFVLAVVALSAGLLIGGGLKGK